MQTFSHTYFGASILVLMTRNIYWSAAIYIFKCYSYTLHHIMVAWDVFYQIKSNTGKKKKKGIKCYQLNIQVSDPLTKEGLYKLNIYQYPFSRISWSIKVQSIPTGYIYKHLWHDKQINLLRTKGYVVTRCPGTFVSGRIIVSGIGVGKFAYLLEGLRVVVRLASPWTTKSSCATIFWILQPIARTITSNIQPILVLGH
jgi:hypothetical protein